MRLLIWFIPLIALYAFPCFSGENGAATKIIYTGHKPSPERGLLSKPDVASPSVQPPAIGTAMMNLYNLEDIAEIKIDGDEIDLPIPLLSKLFIKGQVTSPQPAISFLTGQLILKSGKSVDIHFFKDNPTYMAMENPEFDVIISPPYRVPDMPPEIKPGITRAVFEKQFHVDGGISTPFHLERYVMNDAKIGDEVAKVNVAFKPAGMSDQVYLLGKGATPKQSADDILMRLSPIYLEAPIFD